MIQKKNQRNLIHGKLKLKALRKKLKGLEMRKMIECEKKKRKKQKKSCH